MIKVGDSEQHSIHDNSGPAQLSALTRRDFFGIAATALVMTLPGCASSGGIVQSPQPRGNSILPGYPADSKFLIINADDIGITQSVNAAVISAFERHAIVSGSAMVPCKAFPDFARWARGQSGLDIGIHLTFTSLAADPVRPVLPAAKVPSLVDRNGFFPVRWPTERVVVADEVYAEILAQLGRARELGIDPTHIDAHQHLLLLRGADVFGALVRVAHETGLPYRLAKSWYERAPYLLTNTGYATVPLERLIAMNAETRSAENWASWYAGQIKEIPPGLSELFLHPGLDNVELRSLLPDTNASGPTGRQRDYNALMSDEIRTAIKESGVIRVTWRQVKEAIAHG